jgi:hypothetical protein
MAEKRGSVAKRGGKPARVAEDEDEDEQAKHDLDEFRSTASGANARGDQSNYIAMLVSRNQKLQSDNFDLRRQRRELKAEIDEVATVPDDKVLVDKTAWTAAEKATKVLGELGITDPDTLKTDLPKGRDAVLASAVGDAHGALGLSDQGSAALRQLVIDHKLHLATVVEKVDNKDTRRTYVEKDGKRTPLKDYLDQNHAPYAPLVFLNAKAPTGSLVTATGDTKAAGAQSTTQSTTQERRMPAIGAVGTHRTVTGGNMATRTSSGLPADETAAMRESVVGGLARRYQRPTPAGQTPGQGA